MNVTLDDRLARFSIHSGQVVLIDPLALDGLRPQLIEIGAAPRTEQPALLRVLAGRGLRIGLCSTTDSRPGEYEVGVDSFEAAPSSSDDGVFEVDSELMCVTTSAAGCWVDWNVGGINCRDALFTLR